VTVLPVEARRPLLLRAMQFGRPFADELAATMRGVAAGSDSSDPFFVAAGRLSVRQYAHRVGGNLRRAGLDGDADALAARGIARARSGRRHRHAGPPAAGRR